MNSRRFGKFYVNYDQVTVENLAHLLSAMKFVPTRVECLAHKDEFEYIGMSPQFEEIDQGEMVPEYSLTVSEDDEHFDLTVERKA